MWLTNRSQCVCLEGNVSEWVEVISAVPQGSVLGPLLFLIYINDLEEDIKSLILKFADDTKIFQKIVSEEDSRQLQNDLDVLLQWAEDWQMTFNIAKCKVMHIGSWNLPLAWYYMNGHKLESMSRVKDIDMGVLVSNNLKVGLQCNQVLQKANRMLGLLKRMIDNKTLQMFI